MEEITDEELTLWRERALDGRSVEELCGFERYIVRLVDAYREARTALQTLQVDHEVEE